MQEPTTAPALSVIVPATDEPETLARCRDAIELGLSPADELIVVTEPHGAGPAAARNVGAALARGATVVFVDADVVVHPGALDRIRGAFASDPSLTALFGSYDDSPEAPGVVSGFRNLLHHHVHQAAAGPAVTFWAGLGAIRREAFAESTGFDEERFVSPSVEDIELGMRLVRQGARILLDPSVQGTHLKRWSLAEMVRTDFADRAVPWIGLLLSPRAPRNALNLGWRHRLSAAATLLTVVATFWGRPRFAASAALSMLLLNRSFYALLWQRRGPRQAMGGILLHPLHHLTGIAAVPVGILTRIRDGRAGRVGARRRPAPQSLTETTAVGRSAAGGMRSTTGGVGRA